MCVYMYVYDVNGKKTYSHGAVELLMVRVVGVETQRLHEFFFGCSGAYGGH